MKKNRSLKPSGSHVILLCGIFQWFVRSFLFYSFLTIFHCFTCCLWTPKLNLFALVECNLIWYEIGMIFYSQFFDVSFAWNNSQNVMFSCVISIYCDLSMNLWMSMKWNVFNLDSFRLIWILNAWAVNWFTVAFITLINEMFSWSESTKFNLNLTYLAD